MVTRTLATLVPLASLAGCGGATPAAQAPIEVAVVDVGGAQPANGKTKPAEAKPEQKPLDPAAARKKALEEAAEYGVLGLLNDDSLVGGVLGGVPMGVLGAGTSLGAGGLGLSGVGSGGGGTGFGVIGGSGGLGSIGTIGHGSGTGSAFGSSGGNPVSGQSIHVSGNLVVELGDAVTLGVSIEAGARVLRDRVYMLRDCYRKGLDRNKQLAGSVALRLVVGSTGRVELVRELGSDLADREVVGCVVKGLDDAYVGVPSGSFFGVVESVVRFSPKKP